MAPSKDPSKDGVLPAGSASEVAEPGRSAEARSVLAAIDTTVLAARPAETRQDRRRRTAAFVAMLFSDA
jgi:hypothetical protein